MAYVVEKALDVQIKHPVVLPAAFTHSTHCIVCRFPWTITVGVPVEVLLQFRFPMLFNYHLGYSIGYSGDSQRPYTSVAFGYFYP